MSSTDQAQVIRREFTLKTVAFSAEQEVTVPARIRIPEGTQYLLQPAIMLLNDKLAVLPGPGKVRVQGQLEGMLSCVDGAEQVHTLPIPAQEYVASFTVPALSPDIKYEVEALVDGIESDQGEGSIANITAYLIINLRAVEIGKELLVTMVGGADLSAMTNTVRLQQIVEEIDTRQTVVMDLPIQPEMIPAGTELCLGNFSWMVTEGRLTAEGLVLAKVYYLMEGGKVGVLDGKQGFGLELAFNTQNVSESALSYSLENVSLAIEEASTLKLEVIFTITATGYNEETAEFVSSLTGADSQFKSVRLRNRIGEGEFKVVLEGSCPFAEIPKAYDLVLPRIRVIEAQALDNKVLVRGLLTLNIFYTEDGQRRVLVQEEEFSQFFDLDGCARGYAVKSWMWPERVECGQGRYTVPVLVRVEVVEDLDFTAITDVHMVDPSQASSDASIVLYMVKKGDTLFSIAKKFNTTQELLWEYNELSQQDGLEAGSKLLIPVYKEKFRPL